MWEAQPPTYFVFTYFVFNKKTGKSADFPAFQLFVRQTALLSGDWLLEKIENLDGPDSLVLSDSDGCD